MTVRNVEQLIRYESLKRTMTWAFVIALVSILSLIFVLPNTGFGNPVAMTQNVRLFVAQLGPMWGLIVAVLVVAFVSLMVGVAAGFKMWNLKRRLGF